MIKYVLNTRLDNNKLVDLNGLVSSLDNLRWLNVSTNNLQVMMHTAPESAKRVKSSRQNLGKMAV